MIRIPGPQGLGKAGLAPAQETRPGIEDALVAGPVVAGSGAQVEHQILPDRLHLMHAAAVMAQTAVGLPPEGMDRVCRRSSETNSGPFHSRDVSLLQLPGSGAIARHYATAAPEDRGSQHRSSPVPRDAARPKRPHAIGCPGRLLVAAHVPSRHQQPSTLGLILARCPEKREASNRFWQQCRRCTHAVPSGRAASIIEALLLAAPAREMDGDAGGYFDCRRQDLHELALYLLLLRGRQLEISRDGR
jgi:hypothetical protein